MYARNPTRLALPRTSVGLVRNLLDVQRT